MDSGSLGMDEGRVDLIAPQGSLVQANQVLVGQLGLHTLNIREGSHLPV